MPVGRLTTKTKFQIDANAWERGGRNFREELHGLLCEECKTRYALEDVLEVDHVDPATGEVTRMDILLDCASDTCARDPEFLSPRIPLTRAIFRALIAGGNLPANAEELHARIKRNSPPIILKELLGRQMEDLGIVPV